MLKQLMLSKKIEQRKASLTELIGQEEVLQTRSSELEASIEEATTDEENEVLEEAVTKLETDKAELEEKKGKLEGEIADLEGELEQLNSNEPKNDNHKEERKTKQKGDEVRVNRYKFFKGMTRENIDSLIQREEVKEFLVRARELTTQKRAVTGGELGIPTILLEMLRDNLNQYSKLVSRIYLKPVSGKARQNIAGAVPEGIWTEAVGKLNELNIVFNQVEVDGYKVGGFIAVPNSTLEDSDIVLSNEIMTAIGQAIGLAVDKAILYGTGAKMPVGIVTRLAEVAQPAYWGDNEPAWTNLSASNLLLVDPTANTDVLFYKDLILKCGKVKANYSNGQKFWTMNSNTFATLQAKALTINAAGAIVSGQNQTMPIVGGDIELLDFIPDNHIIGGYGSLYLLVERAGATLAQSEHVQFIDDNTVFKGIARYDGRPVFGEGFVGINIDQEAGAVAPAPADVAFAPDIAN
jgi:HK97 family phage major capsid protein